ncbi:MAG: hypothetical protein LBB45_09050 [Methanobrevibacter sp.]|jgi:hypothetical protein|nr:hypothetical protein [Candidatus Methanovirga basalitermitum]
MDEKKRKRKKNMGKPKLTTTDVEEIKYLTQKLKHRETAKLYNITTNHITKIANQKYWNWVKPYNPKTRTRRKCKYCGKKYTPTHPNQKYCTLTCSRHARQDKNTTYRRKHYKKYKKHENNLGTGLLGAKPKHDFETESQTIIKEKQRLKIN